MNLYFELVSWCLRWRSLILARSVFSIVAFYHTLISWLILISVVLSLVPCYLHPLASMHDQLTPIPSPNLHSHTPSSLGWLIYQVHSLLLSLLLATLNVSCCAKYGAFLNVHFQVHFLILSWQCSMHLIALKTFLNMRSFLKSKKMLCPKISHNQKIALQKIRWWKNVKGFLLNLTFGEEVVCSDEIFSPVKSMGTGFPEPFAGKWYEWMKKSCD